MTGTLGPWVVLFVIVGAMLALGLLVLNRDAMPVPFRRAAAWSAVWISLALGFGIFVATTLGSEAAGKPLAGYLIELSLSVDNVGSVYEIPIALSLAVIVLIFGAAIAASLIATHPNRGALVAPLARITAGTALGLGALGLVALAAAARDGAPWMPHVATGMIVVGAGATASAGVLGLRRGVAPATSGAVARTGAGVLLGMGALGLIALFAALRELGGSWIMLDLTVLTVVTAAVLLGLAALRDVRARTSSFRGWGTVAAATLLIVVLLFSLD